MTAMKIAISLEVGIWVNRFDGFNPTEKYAAS